MEGSLRQDVPPLGLGYIAASIRHNLPNVELVLKESIDDLIAEKPDIIGISAMTNTYYIAIEWARRIKKELSIPVILGGIHISLLPQSLHDCFDVGVVGEGEITLIQLLESILHNNGLCCDRLISIDGLVFRNNDRIIVTNSRAQIDDLDSLPLPNR